VALDEGRQAGGPSLIARSSIDTRAPSTLKYRVFRKSQAWKNHEANVPTVKDAPQTHARLSCAHENESGARGHQRPQSERQGATCGLSAVGTCGKEKYKSARDRTGARRAHVLRRPAEFEAVLRSGRRIASRNFVLRASANDLQYPRLGIIAGRKSARRAVDRNRAKRLVREAFRAALEKLGGHDVAIQLRSDLRGELNDNLRLELANLLDQFVRRASPREP
jgi:ribonuclease P protein component